MKSWLLYTLARLGIFAAALVILLVLAIPWYWATVLAALIGLLVSYIALPKLRQPVAVSLANRREAPEHDDDTDYEDDILDADDSAGSGVISDAERHAARKAGAEEPASDAGDDTTAGADEAVPRADDPDAANARD